MLITRKYQRYLSTSALIAVCIIGGTACGKKEKPAESSKAVIASSITTVVVKPEVLENTASSIGVVNSISSPTISAETSGRVIEIKKDIGQSINKNEVIAIVDPEIAKLSVREAEANAKRLEALLQNQEKNFIRSTELLKKGFISSSRHEEVESQLKSIREQYLQATASLEKAQDYLNKTTIRSPLSGNVVQRLISIGDFVVPGKPIFEISTSDKFQVVLLFPETNTVFFKKGLPVRLSTPATPDVVAVGSITDIVSMIDTNNRSVRIVVEVANPGGWSPGSSVLGEVVLERKENALTVPAQAVVQRPVGKVVYVIENNIAFQRSVETGMLKAGKVEILNGLKVDEVVARDGAGFLTDNTPVSIKEAL